MMQLVKVIGFLFFLFSVTITAQEVKTYKVKKGESLKEIAKKLELNYMDLLRANPGISKKPKKNTILQIPSATLVKPKNPTDLRPTNPKDYFYLPKQQEKDTIVTHKVAPKETLYSLSKLYNVPMATLIKTNPFLAVEGLKIAQELQIPIQKKATKAVIKKTHRVQAKETLYGIAKTYGVGIQDLKDANKSVLVEGLKIGSELTIPTMDIEKIRKDPTKHVIEKGETLYSVSRKYGISVTELLEVNDTVVVDSLAIGSAIQLPSKVVEKVTNSSVSPIYKRVPVTHSYQPGDSLQQILATWNISQDSLKSINPNYDSVIENGGKLLLGLKKTHTLFQNKQWFKDSMVVDKVINAMLMLPFDFKKNDTLTQEILFSNTRGLPTIVADFYMGAALAMDSLQKQGIKIHWSVIDTEKSVDSIHKKIDSIKGLQPNVIIGPLYTDNAMYVATQFPSVPVYYPIYSKKQNRFRNSNIVKTATNKELFAKQVLAYIQENRKGSHLVIVGSKKNLAALNEYKSVLAKRDSLGQIIDEDVTILTLPKGYISKEQFLSKVKLEQENWFLITENNNVMMADVVNNARSVPRDTILETPVRILSFEKSDYADKVPHEILAKYQYTYGTDEVEYLAVKNTNFEKAYRKQNHSYPSAYAIRGFNVTYDAVLRTLNRKKQDVYGASHRFTQAFYYKNELQEATNQNQAVFVNKIVNLPKEGLKIIRLR